MDKVIIPIEFVIDKDLPSDKFKRRKASAGINLCCPFCGSRWKFNVNPKTGFARCAKCGDGDNPVKGFDSIKLHSRLTNLSREKAEKDLLALWNGVPVESKPKYIIPEDVEEKNILMPRKELNEFYKRFLNNLTLADAHRDNLKNRGLSEEQILSFGYKTFSKTLGAEAIKKFFKPNEEIKKLNWAVPGFYNLMTEKPMVVEPYSTGFLIPVKDIEGRITGLQIRHDCGERRYTWLSSTYKEDGIGISKTNNIHHVGLRKGMKTLYLTEGALKADIASILSDRPFIGLTGVSNVKQLKQTLEDIKQKFNIENVIVCVDMDYRQKKEVNAALQNIIKIIRSTNLQCKVASWDENYKGIDDYLLAVKQQKIKNNIKFLTAK